VCNRGGFLKKIYKGKKMIVSSEDFKTNEFDVPQRNDNIPQEIRNYLDSQVDRLLAHVSVNHPFLTWYGENKLTEKQEQQIYLETNTYFKHLPFYVANISTITRDENVLREVLNNSIDELGTTKSHSDLYLDFMGKMGISNEHIESYIPLASSIALNEGIKDVYNTPPLEVALGAIFADETQSAVMCSKYNEGLKFQGHDEKTRFFWELHVEAEIGHSNSIYNILANYVKTPEGRKEFEKGMDHYLNLMEIFWDNVEQLVKSS